MGASENHRGSEAGLGSIYRDEAVRQRILDYLGGEQGGRPPSAYYLARADGRLPTDFDRIEIESWESALEEPGDLARSLADRESLILHLDVEYVDFDSPAEAYVDPWRTFRLQEPVVIAIEEELSRYGIKPLHLLTGQGHHFVWQIPLESAVCRGLAEKVDMTPPNPSPSIESEPVPLGAFRELGLVMEFLASEVRQKANEHSEIPVELTAVESGKLASGRREIISIDISEYGDPLFERLIRIPFTHYEKPWLSGMVERLSLQESVPRFVTLPLHEVDVQQALYLRQSAEEIRSLARRSIVTIPVEERGTERLIEAYLSSRHREFHQEFYRSNPDEPPQRPALYEQVSLDSFPPCVSNILRYPNDLLLKPVALQLITRFLLALGWHPRQIAGFVESKFKNPAFE